MATDVYLTRKLDNSIIPSDPESLKALKRFKIGESFKAKVSKPRNIGHHNKYFALLKLVFDTLPHEFEKDIKSIECLRTEIKMQLGHYEKRHSLGGNPYLIPKSMDFNSMDQIEFEKYYESSIKVICKYILPGVERIEIINQIVAF